MKVFKVERGGANFYFKDRSQAMAFADDNNCYLVEGVEVEDELAEAMCIEYRQFKNTLSKA